MSVCMVFCDLIEGPTGATTWPLLLFFFCATIVCTEVKHLGNASQAKDKIHIYIIIYITIFNIMYYHTELCDIYIYINTILYTCR